MRVGLIADQSAARSIAPYIAAHPAFAFAAQAGVPQQAADDDVQWFDDPRTLIMQAEVSAVLLCLSPHAGAELSLAAIDKGLHVWRLPPLTHTFAEATELHRRLRGSHVVYMVPSWWSHAAETVRDMIDSVGLQMRYSECFVSAVGPSADHWRANRSAAGGGVLAHDAYAMLEALVALRGLPETVQATLLRCRTPRDAAPRETEDIATVLLRYESGLALIRAAWDLPPFGSETTHYGPSEAVRYSDARVTAIDADGKSTAELPMPSGFPLRTLDAFAGNVSGRADSGVVLQALSAHLAVAALLETCYLSARTGQPETPRRLYEVQRWPLPDA